MNLKRIYVISFETNAKLINGLYKVLKNKKFLKLFEETYISIA